MIALLLAAALQTVEQPTYCLDAEQHRVYCADPSAVVGPVLYVPPPTSTPDGDEVPPLNGAAPVTVALASRMADHGFRIGSGIAVNTFTTAWGIQHEGLVEKNELGFSAEARGALKLGVGMLSLASCWKLEKGGHLKAARITSRSAQFMQYAAALWDVTQILTHKRK